MLLSVQSPVEANACTFPKHSLSAPELRVSLIVAAERLAFTAGLEDEGKSLDASLSISDTLPVPSLSIFTDETSKNQWPPLMKL